MKNTALILTMFLAGCTSSVEAKETLLDAGYTEIITGGYGLLACGKDDVFATEFTALNPAGTRNVKGTVCCGILKGCTIRH